MFWVILGDNLSLNSFLELHSAVSWGKIPLNKDENATGTQAMNGRINYKQETGLILGFN